MTSLSQPCTFLLGGHDLEMVQIRDLLQTQGYSFLDYGLSWGAKLSDYKSVLDPTQLWIGIELVEDIPPPSKYLRIDHHNELSHLPASIEQVAALIGVSLNRFQQLVAANDKGYIPAMKAIGASPSDIEEIRRLDRQAQGVTAHDEQLAEISIQQQLSIEHGITVVHALTHKFSPITDRLFGRTNNRLLVYTNTELNYYGEGVKLLSVHFTDLINKHKAYTGGGEAGFFGMNSQRSSEILQVKEQIINILNT